MARILPILDAPQRREFDSPPVFSYQQRKFFFSLPRWAEGLRKELTYAHNQAGFILQLGYFKATGRFFSPTTFIKADENYIRQRYKLSFTDLRFYDRATQHRHRHQILQYFGITQFRHGQQELALEQATQFARLQMNPVLVFRSTADYIRAHRIEVPPYSMLAQIVTEAFKRVEEELNGLLDQHLQGPVLDRLDALLEVSESPTSLPNKPYRITLLKRSLEVLRPAAIKSNIADYLLLKELYLLLTPLIGQLGLSDEMIRYYAQYVIRSQVFQVNNQQERKHLMLICFIIYQYFRLSDLLVETLLASVRTTLNAATREEKEMIVKRHQRSHQTLDDLVAGIISHAEEMEQLELTTLSAVKTDHEKLEHLMQWFSSDAARQFKNLKGKAVTILQPGAKDDPYYQVLEDKSRALQNRVSDIIRYLDFGLEPGMPLHNALHYFKQKSGNLTGPLPEEFLKTKEKLALQGATTKVSLYKALLATHLADYIKGGKANVATSFRYKPFKSYLIDEHSWLWSKAEVLEKALLTPFMDSEVVLKQLFSQLEASFKTTFERMNAGANPLVAKRKDGRPRFITPAQDTQATVPLDLFPQQRFVPIYEVLHAVNQHCRFTDCLTHWSYRHQHKRPSDQVFFAGIMAHGCNLGLTKIAHTSKNVALNTLENTATWYLDVENIQKANDAIVNLMGRLKIGELFKQDAKVVHSSSDGQKFYVQVDSIHANYSYKYFGKEKGITIYSFIDEMHRLFYSTTFSSSEREAAYVIDGLMHNEEVQPDMHSTDTHGYSEVIFALTHLLGIGFAPRIKGFQDGNLYPMEGMVVPPLQNFQLKIGSPVNTQVITENWDTILRVVASIKLKHVSASSLLRRLNSYSRQHPVYQALRELGKLVRTEFLLRYMDQEGLRKRIDNQLQKIESAHHFSRAVFYGNNGEIRASGKEEHLKADACKRLIQNSIICWNYLYLTQLIFKAPAKERPLLIQAIAQSSPVSWQHINLQGEFDFSEESLKDGIAFNLTELLAFDINQNF
jgi:TnpA family transposase